MILRPPLKRGITTRDKETIWVKNLGELVRCISQYFGENKNSFYKELGMKGHNGLDIVCLRGEEIIASHDGVVIEVSEDINLGIGVVLWNKEERIKTLYWHHKENKVKVGQEVKTGDILGLADSTGMSTGDHLHFGCKQTDINGLTINKDNGYFGAVNPLLYLKPHMKLIRKEGTPEVWAVVEDKRYWILDPETLGKGTAIWGTWDNVINEDPNKYKYGGAIFISSTDDPIL